MMGGMVRWWLLILFLLIAGCGFRPARVVKIGLLAPFEGERRVLGYHLLPVARGATPETVDGRRIEWVVLDTRSDPVIAAERARELLVDPAVLAVIGPILPSTVDAVAPVMAGERVAWWPLAPEGAAGLAAWQGALADATRGEWGATVWPEIRRGRVDLYLDPQVPTGETLWPLDLLAREAAARALEALDAAEGGGRAEVAAVALPLALPPPSVYVSEDGQYPGTPQEVEDGDR